MYVQIVGANRDFVFHWPMGSEEYNPILEVLVSYSTSSPAQRLQIAYGFRFAYGEQRRRILVFRNESDVLAEYVGTDIWLDNAQVATFLRREGSKKYVRSGEHLPPRYAPFTVVESESIVSGPYAPRCLAAVASEADIVTLVALALAREEGERSGEEEHIPAPEIPPKAYSVLLLSTDERMQTVAKALISYRTKQVVGGPFTKNPDADSLLRQCPFAFLMAASIDRGARAETVSEIPFRLSQALGHLDPSRLCTMTVDSVEATLRSLRWKPRYPRQAATTIISLSLLVVRDFEGDAAAIWRDKSPREVIKTLQQIHGIGPGIAHMTVRILVDEFSYNPGTEGLRQIDVKPDIHVMRVFYRTGLIKERNEAACVEVARMLNPMFPGLLDWPAWEIGRTWCHESRPECPKCPLSSVCAKLDA